MIKLLERRALAYIIDFFTVFIFLFGLARLFGGQFTNFFLATILFGFIAFYPIGLIYFSLLEGRYGKTLGKKLMNLEVVNKDGKEIGYLEAFIRHLLDIIDFLPSFWIVGIISIIFTDQNRRLGEIAADTKVQRTDNNTWGSIS